MRKTGKDVKVVEYVLRPDEGAARLAMAGAPKGYRFWRMVRRGTKAKVFYVKE